MEPQAISIINFINQSNRTFTIPVYQRNYTWTTKNCEKLFEDAVRAYKDSKEHYFGNVVFYALRTNAVMASFDFALIDGQQRVTSVMLLIAAIRDCEPDEVARDNITKHYLINDSGEKARVKLKQIEGDRGDYEAIISGKEVANPASNVARNYRKFRTLVKSSGMSSEQLLTALSRLRIVALDLKIGDGSNVMTEKPQIIFESINATGRPLSTADLLRNYLLLGIGDAEQEEYYKEYWLPIERNMRNLDEVADFINRYLIMKTNLPVERGSEYDFFKKHFDELFSEGENGAKDALKDLAYYSDFYRYLKDPDNKRNKELSARLVDAIIDINEVKSDYVLPVLLFLTEKAFNSDVSNFGQEELADAFHYLESWLFRARISKEITTGKIGAIGRGLLPTLKNYGDGVNYADCVYYELSNDISGDIWPTDEVFAEAFKKYDFYHYYKNYVMRKLERDISTEKRNVSPDTIEHVMPQTLTEYWRGVLGENYKELHAKYLNTIGNLTPLAKGENTVSSNKPWEEKRPHLKGCSWTLTRGVTEGRKCREDYMRKDENNQLMEWHGDCPSWNIEAIEERANCLADVALNVWCGAKKRERQIEAVIRKNDMKSIRSLENVPEDSVFYLRKRFGGIDIDAKMTVNFDAPKPYFVLLPQSIIAPLRHGQLDSYRDFIDKKDPSAITYSGNIVTVNKPISFMGSDFNSASGIACFCALTAMNGWIEWLDLDTNRTLEEVAKGNYDEEDE